MKLTKILAAVVALPLTLGAAKADDAAEIQAGRGAYAEAIFTKCQFNYGKMVAHADDPARNPLALALPSSTVTAKQNCIDGVLLSTSASAGDAFKQGVFGLRGEIKDDCDRAVEQLGGGVDTATYNMCVITHALRIK